MNVNNKVIAAWDQQHGTCASARGLYSRVMRTWNLITEKLLPHSIHPTSVSNNIPSADKHFYAPLKPVTFITEVQVPVEVTKNTLQENFRAKVKVAKSWKDVMLQFKDNVQTIDLGELEAGIAMTMIASELKYLPATTAFFFILQRRLPVPFLVKLEADKFDYRIKVLSEGKVDILIFKS
ncbi:MAG: hypothetical protein ABIQ31_26100 [Ferruginibacter sp.]